MVPYDLWVSVPISLLLTMGKRPSNPIFKTNLSKSVPLSVIIQVKLKYLHPMNIYIEYLHPTVLFKLC